MLLTDLTAVILITNRLHFILTMLAEEMNASIGPSRCLEPTPSYRALKDLLFVLILMAPLNVKFKRLFLSKLLAARIALMR